MHTRYLGTMSLHTDLAMEHGPLSPDDIRAEMRAANDDALRTAGHDPDTLDPLTRADLLHEITTADMERLTA